MQKGKENIIQNFIIFFKLFFSILYGSRNQVTESELDDDYDNDNEEEDEDEEESSGPAVDDSDDDTLSERRQINDI